VIGTDTHKRTHALSAVDEGTGKVRGHREIDADEPGHLAAVKWARGLDDERVWAIEDCRQVSRRFPSPAPISRSHRASLASRPRSSIFLRPARHYPRLLATDPAWGRSDWTSTS
jgi:hypothetical protein